MHNLCFLCVFSPFSAAHGVVVMGKLICKASLEKGISLIQV